MSWSTTSGHPWDTLVTMVAGLVRSRCVIGVLALSPWWSALGCGPQVSDESSDETSSSTTTTTSTTSEPDTSTGSSDSSTSSADEESSGSSGGVPLCLQLETAYDGDISGVSIRVDGGEVPRACFQYDLRVYGYDPR